LIRNSIQLGKGSVDLGESAMIVFQAGHVPLLFLQSEGGHLLVEAVHVVLENIGLQEVSVGVHAVRHAHHYVAVPMRAFLLQHSHCNQVFVQGANYSRADYGQVEIPIVFAQCLGGHPSRSRTSQQAIDAIVALSYPAKDAFDQPERKHSGAHVDGDCQVLGVQTFLEIR